MRGSKISVSTSKQGVDSKCQIRTFLPLHIHIWCQISPRRGLFGPSSSQYTKRVYATLLCGKRCLISRHDSICRLIILVSFSSEFLRFKSYSFIFLILCSRQDYAQSVPNPKKDFIGNGDDGSDEDELVQKQINQSVSFQMTTALGLFQMKEVASYITCVWREYLSAVQSGWRKQYEEEV